MDKKSLSEIIDRRYSDKVGYASLMEMINEEYDKITSELLTEASESRFSYSIAIPKLVPTEAWGDPSAQSREEINRIFSVVRGGANMKARIEDVNKFLNPETAKRRRSPNVILNMMMIVEALQATLNDYNESSAGFVFEGFMAALTGGKQIAGRVRGTLPIEDFVAFSEIGEGDPVSLKLLGPDTPTHGSFTNLIDYLFVRGAEKITYLIAYKLTVGEKVERLQLFDFVIDRDNIVDVLLRSNNMGVLGSQQNAKNLKAAIANWDGEQGEGLREIALALNDMPGYTKKGMMYNMGRGGEAYVPPEDEVDIDDLPPEERKRAQRIQKLRNDAERIKKLSGAYGIVGGYGTDKSKEERKAEIAKYKAELEDIRKELESLGVTLKESTDYFHEREGLSMKEELLLEGSKESSQWGITRSQMDGMKDIINMRNYGEINLSQQNINELVKIYSEILGDALRQLLDGTKELTENIGRYYSESKRARAMKANTKGQKKGEEIVGLLQEDPKYSDSEK